MRYPKTVAIDFFSVYIMQVSDLNTYALIVGEEICHGMLWGGGGCNY